MTHQINQAQLTGEYKTVLASSSKELKYLTVVTVINSKWANTHYEVKENKTGNNRIFLNIESAISYYNSL